MRSVIVRGLSGQLKTVEEKNYQVGKQKEMHQREWKWLGNQKRNSKDHSRVSRANSK